jgi:hypothetical protein
MTPLLFNVVEMSECDKGLAVLWGHVGDPDSVDVSDDNEDGGSKVF